MKEEIFWKNPGYHPRPPLKGDIECDYLIVGGGIVGVSIAYFLAKHRQKNIVLIEKNHVGSGATGKSAGFLALKGEIDLQEMISSYGQKKGLVYWKGNHQGLAEIKKIIKAEKINCDFEPQHTIYGSLLDSQSPLKVLREYAVEKEIEKDTEFLTGKRLKREINAPVFLYAIKSYDHGLSVNPLKLVQNLSQVIEQRGIKVYESTALLKLARNCAITNRARIFFKKKVILALDLQKKSKISRIRSTIIVTEKLSRKQLKAISLLNHKLVWDSKSDYHYLKVTRDNRILLGYGGKKVNKHHRHRSNELHQPHILRIKRFLSKLFPQLNCNIEYAWSGDFGITPDLIPVVEFHGSKITVGGVGSQVVGIISAKYIADRLAGKRSLLDSFFTSAGK